MDGVFLGLAWLLLGISLGLCHQEIPRSSPASPWKTPSFPPLSLRLTQYTILKNGIWILNYLNFVIFDKCISQFTEHPVFALGSIL